jgi:hypothetical protein
LLFLQDSCTKIFAEGIWDKIFDTETVAALRHALGDEDDVVRSSAVNFFTAVMAQGELCLFLQDSHTKIFAEGIWDKIFDTETILTLGHALSDKNYHVRSSAVKILTAATAQGVLHCFHRIFIPKYLQRAFRTRYLTLRPLLHLDMH